MDASRQLYGLASGFQVTQAIHVAATLRISDLLADGPKSLPELAELTSSDPAALARLLRALTAVGLYADTEGRYENTELGDALRTDAPHSIAGWAWYVGQGSQWQAYGALEHSIRTGETAFPAVHGESLWSYRATHPPERELFDAAMLSVSKTQADAIASAYDFGRFPTIVDVGGGRGLLLSTLLSRRSGVEGVLFDQPAVVAGAHEVLLAAGVADRCQVAGGNFLEAVPEGSLHLLKSVLHDWTDAEAIEILRNCRRAMPADGRLLILEQLLDQAPDPVRTAFTDLNMLVMTGGRERTTDEYRSLLAAAGLTLLRTIPTASDMFVIEAS
ncbi:methyltransferase [Kribbella speibonae]|uniref:Methyltransferase n=1 Tax=Kribbella speibonae TaxID=1572660 RepID=A0A4R0JBX4_9ACTN|nr:methyltransferase [Kribbella speibonae]TCC42096.1 methyltransferase [Kribbella speibonae]